MCDRKRGDWNERNNENQRNTGIDGISYYCHSIYSHRQVNCSYDYQYSVSHRYYQWKTIIIIFIRGTHNLKVSIKLNLPLVQRSLYSKYKMQVFITIISCTSPLVIVQILLFILIGHWTMRRKVNNQFSALFLGCRKLRMVPPFRSLLQYNRTAVRCTYGAGAVLGRPWHWTWRRKTRSWEWQFEKHTRVPGTCTDCGSLRVLRIKLTRQKMTTKVLLKKNYTQWIRFPKMMIF